MARTIIALRLMTIMPHPLLRSRWARALSVDTKSHGQGNTEATQGRVDGELAAQSPVATSA